MSDDTEATPAPPKPLRRRRWWVALLIIGFVLLIVLPAALVGTALWAAGSESGTAWLLGNVARSLPLLQVSEPRGSLVGDFSAKQVVVVLGEHDRVVIDALRWRGLSLSFTPYPRSWAAVHADAMSADRVTVQIGPGDPNAKPSGLPTSLRSPVELYVDKLTVGTLLVPGLEAHPLREIAAKVALGAERGALHRVSDVSLRLDALQVTGQAQIGADGDMPIELLLAGVQGSGSDVALPTWAKSLRNDWHADLSAKGPLARFNAKAALRAQGQSLDATATVAPWDPWPLPQVDASTQALDLSALLTSAPVTALSGTVSIAPTDAKAGKGGLAARGTLRNDTPGRWDEQRLPLRQLSFDVRGRADQPRQFELAAFEAVLAGTAKPAGSLSGTGRVDGGNFELNAVLDKVAPSELDPNLPAMTLSGPVTLSGQTHPPLPDGSAQPPSFKALVDLKGQLLKPARAVQLKVDAQGDERHIELRELRASAGAAQASLSGSAERGEALWQAKAKGALVDFDPAAWFPGPPESSWHLGPHRLNVKGELALTVPDSVTAPAPRGATLLDRLAALRGDITAVIGDSVLAGVPLTGDIALHHPSAAAPFAATVKLDAGGNALNAEGTLATDAKGAADRWHVDARAPVLARLQPLLKLLPGAQASGLLEGLNGSFTGEAELTGRWPDVKTQGKGNLAKLRAGPLAVGQADLHWQAGSSADAPLELNADITQGAWHGQGLDSSRLQLQGTARSHTLNWRTELKALPPAWVDNVQPPPAARAANAPAASAPLARAAASAAPAASAPPASAAAASAPAAPTGRTLVLITARGGLSGAPFDGSSLHPGSGKPPTPLNWKGTLQQAEVRSSQPGSTPWLLAQNVDVEVQAGDAPWASVSAGRADILGAGLRWDAIRWQAGQGVQTQQLDVQAELQPVAIAPLLRRLQPDFGWGGDLQIGGKIVVHQAAEFSADIVLERVSGDLSVTDETGTQPLGLTDLRLGLSAQDGVWNFTQGLAGNQLGVAAGAIVVRTSPKRAWPEPDAPVQGVLEAQVANLGTWGAWVPAGWRLGGKLGTTATIGGRFGAIEYTGHMKGSGLSARNILQGVNVTDGEVDIALQGDNAKINTFQARAGNGTVKLSGAAEFGEKPHAQMTLVAERFQLLGRVDRRIVTSGQAQVELDRDNLKVDGKFKVDEGLFDFSLSSAPSLSGDVVVINRTADIETTAPTGAPSNRNVAVDLTVNLGEALRLRGRGIDTRLEGELKLTTPGGKLALNGSVRAVDGTYNAYGQKLDIDRGVITFTGTPENPRLDIEATRPNTDVRVGVAITGTALTPRVRLFSEPELSDIDKLSWMLLGRASDGLGKSDTALLQRAALALLSGEGGGADPLKVLGIDDLSVSQNTNSATDVRETVVSLGKQLSRRWYVGYERSLNATTGNWQLIYRIAQRFTLRAQSGLDNSLDFIWTLRWQ
ncbi:translocation/assembly module TamB domain-containing protein [Rhizobacter sp. OV335]|uniref:translocation/assembly module TamB domain-containing protein n=1 Tax=Rhizobacter sp. OV335 TaxID=1500264 RepID=UPI0009229369|nr:translocation/assembly module TamB domain-containing protein [Rhizobacter sp. OV335]SHN26480.1 autotransporter secretion inner membrane protein TamB [Rhizobacter sp. OV335]